MNFIALISVLYWVMVMKCVGYQQNLQLEISILGNMQIILREYKFLDVTANQQALVIRTRV